MPLSSPARAAAVTPDTAADGADTSGAPVPAPATDPDARREITTELLRALDSVAVAKPAAMRVLSVVDNPNTNAQMVAQAIELDPTFAAQIMRLGNSAYYGMSGKVGNTGFAVSVIGFAAVRSMAAISATGLSTQSAIPDGFWRHAAAAAAGASVVAPRLGLAAADCFAAGLLHDVGTAFLHGFDRDGHMELIAVHGTDGAGLAAAEADRYGMGHDAAAAHVLASWKFPTPFVEAVAWHHMVTEGNPLATAVRLGDLLAHLSEDYIPPRVDLTIDHALGAEHGHGHRHDDAELDVDGLPIEPPPAEPEPAQAFDPEIVQQLIDAGIEAEVHEELAASTFDRAAEILSTLPI